MGLFLVMAVLGFSGTVVTLVTYVVLPIVRRRSWMVRFCIVQE